MIAEPFAVGSSRLHRLDPRVRLVAAGFFAVVVAGGQSFAALSAACLLAVGLVRAAALERRAVLRRLVWVNTFVLLFWLILPLTYAGPPLWELGPWAASRAGVALAARITLKSNAIVLSLVALVSTMTTVTLGYCLNALRLPPKIVHLLLMTYRYIFVIEAEYARLLRAARIRAFRPATRLHAYRTYAFLVGMLFVRAANRAERVFHAMQCRGFKGRFYPLYDFPGVGRDRTALILLAVMILTVGLMECAARLELL